MNDPALHALLRRRADLPPRVINPHPARHHAKNDVGLRARSAPGNVFVFDHHYSRLSWGQRVKRCLCVSTKGFENLDESRVVWLDGSAESPTRIGVEIVWSHDQELQPVRGNEGFPALVVESALKTAVNATDGESIRLVEEGSRSVVLTLSILDNQPERGPVSVYRKSNLPAALPGVTFEPFKAMLSRRGLTEDRVTEVDHIRFVTGGTTTRTLLIAHGAPEAEPLR